MHVQKKISYSTVLEDETYTVSQTYRLVSLHDFSRVHKIMLFKSSVTLCNAVLPSSGQRRKYTFKIRDSQNQDR